MKFPNLELGTWNLDFEILKLLPFTLYTVLLITFDNYGF